MSQNTANSEMSRKAERIWRESGRPFVEAMNRSEAEIWRKFSAARIDERVKLAANTACLRGPSGAIESVNRMKSLLSVLSLILMALIAGCAPLGTSAIAATGTIADNLASAEQHNAAAIPHADAAGQTEINASTANIKASVAALPPIQSQIKTLMAQVQADDGGWIHFGSKSRAAMWTIIICLVIGLVILGITQSGLTMVGASGTGVVHAVSATIARIIALLTWLWGDLVDLLTGWLSSVHVQTVIVPKPATVKTVVKAVAVPAPIAVSPLPSAPGAGSG